MTLDEELAKLAEQMYLREERQRMDLEELALAKHMPVVRRLRNEKDLLCQEVLRLGGDPAKILRIK